MVDDFGPYRWLALAALAWFVLHKGVAGSPVRGLLVARLGERGFRLLFSALSLVALGALVSTYRGAPCSPLWTLPRAVRWLPNVVMPLAFLLLVGAFSAPNPTALGGERALSRADAARGVLRITRHPFLWAVSLWSGSHFIVNGNVPAALFFGSMLLTALYGTRDIDQKRAHAEPAAFASYAERTSNLPFLAILRGRNTLELRELAVPGLLSCALTALVLGFHQRLFMVSPFP